MSFLSTLFNELLYRPLFNGLVFLYNVLPGHDFGIAIIVLTVLIRLLLYPLFQHSIKSQRTLAKLQPKIKEIQRKCANNKEKQAKETMALYKENKINPMGGCLPLVVQVLILFAFFRVLWTGLDAARLNDLYSFVSNPGSLSPFFLGVIDLSKSSPALAVLAGIAQFIQSKMMMFKDGIVKDVKELDFGSIFTNQMVYIMPVLTIFIGCKFPAGLPLYWLVLTIFGILQQYFTTLKNEKEPERIKA